MRGEQSCTEGRTSAADATATLRQFEAHFSIKRADLAA
jgi:hypothetical protein